MSDSQLPLPHLRAMNEGSRSLTAVALLLLAVSALWLYLLLRLFSDGHTLFETSSYGAFWGIGVANIVHIIGISHVGIAVSAAVRLLRLEHYRNVARLAEILTLVCLAGAVLGIAIDVGRPERFILQTLIHGRWRAPMVWSMTVISLYFMASATYLYLSLRRDLARISHLGVRGARIYRFLSFGYRDTAEDRARHDRVLRWLALALLPIMVSVHSVYGLIFGLLTPKDGWHNPLQAPYFVLAAIVSGFSAILVVVALVRRAFRWQELLPDRILRAFGAFLAFAVFLFLYFLGSEQLTAQLAYDPGERASSAQLLYGHLSGIFWPTVVVGLLLPMLYLLLQALGTFRVSVGGTTAAAIAINLALWTKRVLLVVPAQLQSHLPLPRPAAPYSPAWGEWILTLGIYALTGLAFVVLLRLLPVIELPSPQTRMPGTSRPAFSRLRLRVVLLTLGAAAFMIAWGHLSSGMPFAPLRWIVGLALLVLIPLEWCLIPDLANRSRSGNLALSTEGTHAS